MDIELLQKKMNKRLKVKHKRRQDRMALNILFSPNNPKSESRHYFDTPLIRRTQRHPASTPMHGQVS